LVLVYALGAIVPGPGLRLREVRIPSPSVLGGDVKLPTVLLGVLLFVAGLTVGLQDLKRAKRRLPLVAACLLANAIFPVLFTAGTAAILVPWHDPTESQSLLVGLAMVGVMPIAGSSTAWVQNAEGDVALSLALVWGSTLLSPVLTPLGLHAIGLVTRGDYAEDLHEVAQGSTVNFLLIAVLLPSILGLVAHWVIGTDRVRRLSATLKIVSLADLMLLNYLNAAAALPQAYAELDWDFLALVVTVTTTMCLGAFALGWWTPRALSGERSDRIATMFGVGMNNNGTGLVFAAQALADHRLVLLPIILYNLEQQLVAGIATALLARTAGGADQNNPPPISPVRWSSFKKNGPPA
jgi:BASS family bile acid:Na+ symporter